MSEYEHSPTPWKLSARTHIESADEWCVTDLHGENLAPVNAEHIVRCVNVHDDLVDALEENLHWICMCAKSCTRGGDDDPHCGPQLQARAVLAKARGES
jgi:hypothetical protein